MRRAAIATLIAGALVFTGGQTTAATKVITASGSFGSFEWDPSSRTIHVGSRIKWTNGTDTSHVVAAYSDNWGKNTTIAPDESTTKKFKKKGTYLFRCTITGHSTLSNGDCSGMCGKVVVKPHD